MSYFCDPHQTLPPPAKTGARRVPRAFFIGSNFRVSQREFCLADARTRRLQCAGQSQSQRKGRSDREGGRAKGRGQECTAWAELCTGGEGVARHCWPCGEVTKMLSFRP